MASERRQREKEAGKRTRTKDRKDSKTCGAGTMKCANCGCHRREHKLQAPGVRLPCSVCGTEKCQGWKPKPCDRGGTYLMRNGRCADHGGKSLSGIEQPQFSKGIYSKVVPRRLAEHYERLLADDELLSLRHEIALTRTYIRDNVAKIGRDEWVGPAAIKAVRRLVKAWNAFESATTEQQEEKAATLIRTTLDDLEKAMTTEAAEIEARAEFREFTTSLERLERSENARVVQLYNMISAERAFALRTAETTIFIKALETHITDDGKHLTGRELRNAIRRTVAADLAELARGRNYQALGTGGGPIDVDGDVVDSSAAN